MLCQLFFFVTTRLPYILLQTQFFMNELHIDLDYHFVNEKLQAGLIYHLHVSSSNQLCDMFTKQLGISQFHFLLSKLGVLDPHNLA